MIDKGFEADLALDETPGSEDAADKPLKFDKKHIGKVDINVLKARAHEIQNKENRKNLFILLFFLIALGVLGIYLSI